MSALLGMGATALGMGATATRKILGKVTTLMPMSRRPMNPNEEQQFAKAVEAHKAALEVDKDAAGEMSDNDRVDAFDQGTEGVTEQTCYQKNGCSVVSGFLGRGATAKVYKLGSDVTMNKFDDGIGDVKMIKLYCDDKAPVVITISGEITEIRNFINNQEGFIAKVFYGHDKTGTAEDLFYSETSMTKLVNGLYGTEANIDNYLTTIPLKYQTRNIIGVQYIGSNTQVLLNVLFNKICNNKFYKDKIDIIKFCKDILESLIILNGKGYRHNDIKIDNIVNCDGKFKLIDWGYCRPLDKYIEEGDYASVSPIKQRLGGLWKKDLVKLRNMFAIDPRLTGSTKEDAAREQAGWNLALRTLTSKMPQTVRNLAKTAENLTRNRFSTNQANGRLRHTLQKDIIRHVFDHELRILQGREHDYGPIPGEIKGGTHQLYASTLVRRAAEYNKILNEKRPNDNDLKAKFRETLDVYMLGMCVLTLVVPGRSLIDIGGAESKRFYAQGQIPEGAVSSRPPQLHHMRLASVHEQPAEAKEIVGKFTSLTNPMNPTEALKWIENTFQSPVYSMYFDTKEEVDAFEGNLAAVAQNTNASSDANATGVPTQNRGANANRGATATGVPTQNSNAEANPTEVPTQNRGAHATDVPTQNSNAEANPTETDKEREKREKREKKEREEREKKERETRKKEEKKEKKEEENKEKKKEKEEEKKKTEEKKKKGGTKKTASKARRSKRRLIATKTKKRR